MEIKIDKKHWNSWLKMQDLSDRTIYEYNLYLERFGLDLTYVSKAYLFNFLRDVNTNVARAFLNKLRLYIKSMDFPQEVKGVFLEFDVPKITGRKKRKIPIVLDEKQIHMLSSMMPNERSKIMTLLAFYGGLRLGELCNILPYDFNWEVWLKDEEKQGSLKVKGKGNKERIVFVPSFLMKRIHYWIVNYVSKRQTRDQLLFKGTLANNFNRYITKQSAKMGTRITPHGLRHSCGTWLKQHGFDIRDIQEYLGHESISTTQIYAHVNPKELKNKYEGIFGNPL